MHSNITRERYIKSDFIQWSEIKRLPSKNLQISMKIATILILIILQRIFPSSFHA